MYDLSALYFRGLGKTIQTISFLGWLLFEEHIPGPYLVVVPYHFFIFRNIFHDCKDYQRLGIGKMNLKNGLPQLMW
jgi:hypothetical protein